MNESCAGAQRSKKAVQRLLNRQPSKALLAGSIFLCVGLSGCGLSDLYKDKEKRCKLNCTTEDSDSKKSVEPFNFDLEYWNKTTPRSKLDPGTEVTALLRSNPFKLLANALKTAAEDTADAKKTTSSATPTPQAECLQEVFGSAFEQSGSSSSVQIDYGRCVDLIALQDRLNSNRNVSRDGLLKVIELGSALQLKLNGSIPLANNSDALHSAQTAFDLPQIFPFKAVRGGETSSPNSDFDFSFHLMRGSVQGVAIERASSPAILKKSWGLLLAGLNQEEPLKLKWSPASGELKVVGSLATLSASFQRPTTQTQWDSFGYSREFIFADFTLTESELSLGPTLGWSEQTAMSGSYYLRLNGDLVGTGGSGSQLFRMQGLGRPCLLNVGLVTGFNGDTPQEQPLGQISICNSSSG
jgi:hypothetical protein